MLTDEQRAVLEPLVEACRPKGKTPPQDLRRTVSAIVWRQENGANHPLSGPVVPPRRLGATAGAGAGA